MDKIRMFNDESSYTQEAIDLSRDFGLYLRNSGFFSKQYDVREIAHLLILEVMEIECEFLLDETYASSLQL